MTDENERIRGYIVGQADRYDWVDLWPRVVGQRTALLQAMDGLTDEQAHWRPGSGEAEEDWSILEIARHLLPWTRNVADIIEATAAGRTVEKLPMGYLEPDASASFADVRRSLVAESMRFARLPVELPATPNLATTVDHPRFGPLNCRAWFFFLRLHDGDHTRQVEALKEAPDFPT